MTHTSFRLFLFILAFAPLAFGTTEHWSMTTVQLLTGLALFLYFRPSASADESW